MLFFKKNRKKQEEAKNIKVETAPEIPVKTLENLEAEKAAAKAAAKEKAIAEYRQKRDLTVAKFFEITEMELPEHLQHLADRRVENITADVRRVTENDIYFYWQMAVIDRDTTEVPEETPEVPEETPEVPEHTHVYVETITKEPTTTEKLSRLTRQFGKITACKISNRR